MQTYSLEAIIFFIFELKGLNELASDLLIKLLLLLYLI